MEKKKQSKKQKKRLREEKGGVNCESPVQKKLNSSALKPALLHNINEQSNSEAISSESLDSPEAGKCEILKKTPKSLTLSSPVLPNGKSPSTPTSSLSKKAKRKLAKMAQGELINDSQCNIASPLDIKNILPPEVHIAAEARNDVFPAATCTPAKSCEVNLIPASTSDCAGSSKDIVLRTNSQINRLIDLKDQMISSLKQSVSRLTEENKLLVKELSALKESSEKLKNGLYCAICLNYYHVPHNLECGHVFCFCCIRDWLTTLVSKEAKLHCPLCRLKVEKTPNFVLALHLHLIETLELEESKHPNVIASIRDHMIRYEDESRKWQTIFPDCGIRTTLWDGDDDVARCTTCNWEVVGKSCANCGATYSGDSENEITDSDTCGSEHSSHSGGPNADDHESEDSDASNDSFVCLDDEIDFDSNAGSDDGVSDTNALRRTSARRLVVSDDETDSDVAVDISEPQPGSSPTSKPVNSPTSNFSKKNKPRSIILSGSDAESSEDEIITSKEQPRSLQQIQSDSE